jgi:hypothetical protein
MSLMDKLKLVKIMYLVSGIGNMFFFCSLLFFNFSDNIDLEVAEIFAGIGCFLLWTSIIGNLQNTQYYVVWRTFENAAPLVLRVALGVLPFFVGFLMIGVACFSFSYM